MAEVTDMLDFDVVIVGAGLSGIGAARHLQLRCPNKKFVILEGRECLGGTWDLFRYPGIRSDSDMHTMGYSFRPWVEDKAIADGPSILKYLQETAHEFGIEDHIRYCQRVVGAAWSSREACWTVEIESGPGKRSTRLKCRFLFLCSGYYDYDSGYAPEFASVERFKGRVVHPQHWPSDLEYAGKRVVVIGSGATAVTLVPAMAKTAAHVTMLQRSPSYVASRPGADAMANKLRRILPAKAAYGLTRWKNILLAIFFYQLARRQPKKFSNIVIRGASAELGADYDVATHFTPRYKPWDQRLCLVPDGDLFKAIRSGAASVVTDRISNFTENGILLESGVELEADVVVTATGLKLQLASGRGYSVDGAPIDMVKSLNYKGVMFSGMPNFALTVGYTNASWTLKAELTSLYVCRLLNYMDRRGWRSCVPRVRDSTMEERPIIDFTSGYIQRALEHLPKQGSKRPWRLRQNYPLDLMTLKYGKLDDGNLEFSR